MTCCGRLAALEREIDDIAAALPHLTPDTALQRLAALVHRRRQLAAEYGPARPTSARPTTPTEVTR